MAFRISDISLQDLLTSLYEPVSCHWYLSIAHENSRKPLVLREKRKKPLAWNERIH